MFDFEKLTVYQKSKVFNQSVSKFLHENQNLDRTTTSQFRRAAMSIMLNIAEGSGRLTNADKRNFYVIARGSAFECVAISDYLKDIQLLDTTQYKVIYDQLEQISKMLFSLIKGLR